MAPHSHRSLFRFYNFVGVFNFKVTSCIEISKITVVRNFFLLSSYILLRVFCQAYIRSSAINKQVLLSSNTSNFFQLFAHFSVFSFQVSGFICIYFQIWNRENVLDFLKSCLNLKTEYQSESFNKLKSKFVRSFIFLGITFLVFYIYHFNVLLTPNWYGFVYATVSRVSDIFLLSLISFISFSIHFLTFLIQNFHDLLQKNIENYPRWKLFELSYYLAQYDKIYSIAQKFNKTFGFILSVIITIICMIVVTQVKTFLGCFL